MTTTLKRDDLLAEMMRVGRENSDATVIYHSAVATKLGVHPTDYKVLSILDRMGPLSAGEVARHSGLATASVTNLIDRLENKGFVQRIADPADRRRVLVRVIVDREDVAAGRASMQAALDRLLKRYSNAELAVIVDFLGRNAERLRTATEQLSCSQ
jgi:DNA-binding MarR family transcriptional regulator